MTTGLQSITVNSGVWNDEIVCEFLPGSKADGCLLEWHPVNLINGEKESIMLKRENRTRVGVHLQSLMPGMSYEVNGFGLQGNDRLHSFPITLQGGLNTTLPSGISNKLN